MKATSAGIGSLVLSSFASSALAAPFYPQSFTQASEGFPTFAPTDAYTAEPNAATIPPFSSPPWQSIPYSGWSSTDSSYAPSSAASIAYTSTNAVAPTSYVASTFSTISAAATQSVIATSSTAPSPTTGWGSNPWGSQPWPSNPWPTNSWSSDSWSTSSWPTGSWSSQSWPPNPWSTSSPAPTSAIATQSAVPTPGTTPSPQGTLGLNFVNNMVHGQVYAYLTGTDTNGQLVMLTQDGEFYYPSSSTGAPVEIQASANVALTLAGYGQTTRITIPQYITSARLWVSQGQPLKFSVSGTGLVEPSSADDTDPNHNTNWGFIEFTFNSPENGGLYANLSFVDFIGLPLGMMVSGSDNTTQTALGPHKNAKESVCKNLQEQAKQDGQPWDQLCKYDHKGHLMRVVSPQTLVTQNSSAFASYFDDYVNAVFEQYSTTPLVIETQSASGTINCTASGDQILCEGDDTPFTKPTAGDIFGCASGPFENCGNDVHLAAVPRVCAAFNRATLHLPGGNVQPHLPPSHYYAPPATNYYSRYVHDAEIDGKGYAFAYDDVSPDQSEYNTAGLVAVPDPYEMTVYVGGYKDFSS